jgi:3-hydroxyacyl-[acyl-carrier-protein] dehydratase
MRNTLESRDGSFRLLETGENRFQIEIPAASPLFAGHFPGHPILPGIAHLAMVERALGEPLAAVRSMKIRRPVMPGETLELSLGAPGGDGWTRFEIRREEEIVSNGAVATGPGGAEPEETAFPAVGEFPILLPHAPPARLVHRVLAASALGIVCAAEVPPSHPLAVAGRVPALLGIEAAAQAAAVLEALARREGEDPAPRIGYLVGVREARFAAPSLPTGQPLRVSATLQGSAPPLSIYEIKVEGAVTGTVSTFLAEPARDDAPRDNATRDE